MSDELLDTYIRQLLEAHPSQQVNISWQGEPTHMGLGFFKRAVEYVEKYRKPGQSILHRVHTDGALLNDEWCAFLNEHRFLVGLSILGPGESLDHLKPGADLLRRHKVDFNILCAIHSANADHPIEVYRFLRDQLKAKFIQFIPLVERTTHDFFPLADLGWRDRPASDPSLYAHHGALVTPLSVGAEQFGRFLIAIFDEWVRRDVGNIFVQTFDVALGSWLGQHDLCIFSPTCGDAVALEPNGDLYSCEHYVEPGYRLGNIRETPMAKMVDSEHQRAFGQRKLSSLPKYCRECDVLFACNGECPRNRFIAAPDGEPGLNYLCAGYKMFFHHIDPAMKIMAGLLRKGHWADEIMRMYEARDSSGSWGGTRVNRDGPCPCRSGKKFKHCHGGVETGHGNEAPSVRVTSDSLRAEESLHPWTK